MSRRLLVGTVLVAAGIMTAVFGLSATKPVYAHTVSEFLANPIHEQNVRVQGVLVRGSLCRESAGCGYRFRLADRRFVATDAGLVGLTSPELSVHYPECVVPDTFRDLPGVDVDMSVEGELCANCHRFEASLIIAKCPAVYGKGTYGHGRAYDERYPRTTLTRPCAQPEPPSGARE